MKIVFKMFKKSMKTMQSRRVRAHQMKKIVFKIFKKSMKTMQSRRGRKADMW
ncbi:unnamed protein product [Cladocopium goreaui]|uniref:Uncharacterized protein n=1 Tax=Cladocopium goreaui TaxID=2562237 RepID=A0A9P1BIK9_9DINO|nr:unnamed protein product [Cladocopium goreaui]